MMLRVAQLGVTSSLDWAIVAGRQTGSERVANASMKVPRGLTRLINAASGR